MSAADSRSWVLGSETHRQLVGSLIAGLERGWIVRIDPPRRTLDQNRLLHALISEAVDGGLTADDGRRLTLDEAKTGFDSGWMIENGHGSDIIGFGGNPVQLRRSTTTFTKAELSSLIEYIQAECHHRRIPVSEPREPEIAEYAR